MYSLSRASRPVRWVAAGAAAATLVALVVTGQVREERAATLDNITLNAAIAAFFGVLGLVVLRGVPGHPVGRLMAATGAVSAAAVLAGSWSGWVGLAWLSQWLWWPPLGLVVLSLLVFPDGKLPSPRWWWRALAAVVIVGTVLATLALAVAAVDQPRDLVSAVHDPYTARAQLLKSLAKVFSALAVGGGLAGVVAGLVARWRRADGELRLQLACLLPAPLVVGLGLALEALPVLPGAWKLATGAVLAVPVCMTVAVLRYRLYGLDRIINRTVVWLAMSLLLLLAFILLVMVLRNVFTGGDPASPASLAAAVLIAVASNPLRRKVQHQVDFLFYGERDDPYKVIARLGDRIRENPDPDEVLPLQIADIARSMQVPYVGVELAEPDGPRLFAERGVASTVLEALDMVANGARVGRLLVATRQIGGRFTRAERRLLTDAAVHLAVVAQATGLIRDLRDSQDRLAAAREQERRRLRRDLHDGVGGALTGMSMQVAAARKLIDEPRRLAPLLDGLADDLRTGKEQLREVVDQLRPHTLDGGLEMTLRAVCQRFTDASLSVQFQANGSLDGLPTAVELAAYMIASEAVHNVAKHARASTCRVTVDRYKHRALTMEIVDDGIGIAGPATAGPARRDGPADGRRGVGLESMRERAVDVGGRLEIAPASPQGTAIRVTLPVTVSRQS